jgi:hypothetical protein
MLLDDLGRDTAKTGVSLSAVVRVHYKWVAAGLILLLVGLGASPLTIARASAPDTSLAPCHHSQPNSPDSHKSDHSCCALGHNKILPTSRTAPPPLQFSSVIENALGARAATGTEVQASALFDSSPPLTSSLPIRI